jgi:hypothetical protein
MQPKLWTRRSLLLTLAGASMAVPACDFSQLFSWNDGNPVILGYSSRPNYDRRYKTIRVKIFKDPTFWAAVPVPGLEMQLTEEIVHRIEADTPYKVCSGDADTELSGTILSFLQMSLNYNQMNEIREVETDMTCAVRWRDLRTGQILSWPAPRNLEPPPPAGLLPGQQDPIAAGALPGSLLAQPLSAAGTSPGGGQATMAGGPPTTADASPPPDTGNPMLGQTNALGPPGGPPGSPLTAAMNMFGSVLVRSVAFYRPEIGESLATAQQQNCLNMAQQIANLMEVAW